MPRGVEGGKGGCELLSGNVQHIIDARVTE
jgi:hypothetical protein